MRTLARLSLFLMLLLPAGPAPAVLHIEITQGITGAQPIAVVPFHWNTADKPPLDVAQVIAADLARSGRFRTLPIEDMLEKPTEAAQIDFKDWRVLEVDFLVIGRVIPGQVEGGHAIQFQLFDVVRGQQIMGYSIPVGPGQLRRGAHRVSDMIYEKLTGERGAFNTRIAFVTVQRDGDVKRYNLMVADADGENQQSIVQSVHPIMSPSWSPDGRKIAYVSFENRQPEIFVQELASGRRESVSSRPGINGAPAWSPDGTRLALTLSSGEDNPDIYVYELLTKRLLRITNDPAIDTEPVWFPDGRQLAFTSDRGGGPQIYVVDVGGGKARRLTFEGRYNARPRVSPDGKLLAMVHQDNGGYHIAVMDIETGTLRELTDGRLDESPSFAPNGSMIIYATEEKGRGVLAAVSVDGRVRQRLALQEGDVREPAWSPLSPIPARE